MKNFLSLTLAAYLFIFLTSCNNNKNNFDASGSFEAVEVIISAEASGTIMQFNIEEGETLQAGQAVGYIDSTQLFLKKEQLQAQVKAMLSRKPDISAQIASPEEQLKSLEREKNRISNLVKAEAATTKQLDDINSQIDVVKKQIEAQKSSLGISTAGISKDVVPLQLQIAQVNDQLSKCKIINPINGTVLSKYSEPNELAVPGKPLFKIADLGEIILRAYITGNQLASVKLNQKVKVLTDDGKGGYKEAEGTVTWINDKAEFTPKTIQTKDERANLVYAVKVKLKNDGTYKIGMYGEIRF